MSRELEKFSAQVVDTMPLLLREMVRREDNELTRGTISFPQMVAMHYALRHPAVKMADMARVLSTRPSSASTLIDRLVRSQLMSREHDEKDRRIVWIRLTPKGKKTLLLILSQKKKSMREIFRVLSPKERREYLSALLKVRSHLEKRQ